MSRKKARAVKKQKIQAARSNARGQVIAAKRGVYYDSGGEKKPASENTRKAKRKLIKGIRKNKRRLIKKARQEYRTRSGAHAKGYKEGK